jgi:hypothetical protein
MSEENQEIYKFKWTNFNLDSYLSARHEAANSLRRDADILIQRADQIDKEAYELRASLIKYKAPE